MHKNSSARTVTVVTSRPSPKRAYSARAILSLAAAAALAACDDSPVQPKANIPTDGVKSPSAVVHIIPPGQTFPAKIAYATGSPVGKDAKVQIYDAARNQLASFYAFSAADDFYAGVDVAVADVNGDGYPEIIAGEGATPNSPFNMASQVNIWDGKTGTLIQTMTPFSGFKNGIRVGAGDLDADGKAEILACTGVGVGGNRGLAFKFGSSTPIFDSQSNLETNGAPRTGGCHIAAGDINGDGFGEIVSQFDGSNNVLLVQDLKAKTSMLFPSPLGWQYLGQAAIATGDVNGDNKADVMLSMLQTSAIVRVFDASKMKQNVPLTMLKEIKPVYEWQSTGVDIAARDVNGDGIVDLLFKATKATPFGAYSSFGMNAGPSLANGFSSFLFAEPGKLAPGGPIG
jgi:hypothetical protein